MRNSDVFFRQLEIYVYINAYVLRVREYIGFGGRLFKKKVSCHIFTRILRRLQLRIPSWTVSHYKQ